MTKLLILVIATLAFLTIGLIWIWLVARPKSVKYQAYAEISTLPVIRNRLWDSAVARARNRNDSRF